MDAAQGRCPMSFPVGRSEFFGPHPELSRLAVEDPIRPLTFLNGEVGWLVSSYELGRAVLADRRFSAERIYGRQPFGDLERWLAEGAAEEGHPPHLNECDPPDHTRRRRAIMSQLTLPRVKERSAAFQRIIDDRLDEMERVGSPVDFVEAFAVPVPSLVLCELLGVPAGDRELFVSLTDRIRDPDVPAEQQAADVDAFYVYVEEVVADKRRHPGNDILSELISIEELTHEELVKEAVTIFQAGHETTTTQFAYGLLLLLHRREHWDALKADPSTVGGVVEELFRYLTIVDANPTERTALEDVELGGVVIRAGESVVVSALAANRDPGRFEAPDVFDPARDARGHLALGFGIHMCAGQHVARLELQLGFAALARRFPDLRLDASPEEIRWLADAHQMSGPTTLPVAW